ncbi:MAG TPA: 3-methyl-2-oxobutanoate hydroxymethyltransferase, partial [Thermoanaerobaculia bacterium]|nr:3-methyl-2-oxobutanoate hydroxymethyltransferase [Thermoanaerobaculia bacterium]
AVPTIGIGAGPKCDGQILVLQDMLGLTSPGGRKPRFVRRYADLSGVIRDAVTSYVDDVSAGRFPSEAESFQSEADVPPPAAFRIYG